VNADNPGPGLARERGGKRERVISALTEIRRQQYGANQHGDFGFWILDFGLAVRIEARAETLYHSNPKSKI
jgi:hypothetical protein